MEVKEVFDKIEEGKRIGQKLADLLDSDRWVWYILQSNELTNNYIPPRKCIRRTLRAHSYLSDYFKKSL